MGTLRQPFFPHMVSRPCSSLKRILMTDFVVYRLGPNVRMLLLDCRTERKKTQIVSEVTYQKVFAAMRAMPSTVTHLILLLGVSGTSFAVLISACLTVIFRRCRLHTHEWYSPRQFWHLISIHSVSRLYERSKHRQC